MLWIAAAGSLIHPTAGMLGFGLATLPAAVEFARTRRVDLLVHWLAAAALCVAPSLYNIVALPVPPAPSPASLREWYDNMIKREADDFSFLYHVANSHIDLKAHAKVVGALTTAYLLLVRRGWRDINLWALVAITGMFALGAVAEELLAVRHPSPLIALLIPLTPSYRLLSYAFFPFMVLAVRLAADILWRLLRLVQAAAKTEQASLRVLAAVACLLLVGIGLAGPTAQSLKTGRARETLAFGRWSLAHGKVAGLDQFMLGQVAAGQADAEFHRPILYLNPPIYSYPGERAPARMGAADRGHPRPQLDETSLSNLTIETFADTCERIRQTLPRGSGLITPPYLRYFRDCLPDHAVFFQDRHDSNLMMGSPKFFAFWKPRMIAIVGKDYDQYPQKRSGIQPSLMRQAYLNVDDAKAAELFRLYPAYRYFVAERQQRLDFQPVISNPAFVVYDLARPSRPPAQ
jgi:hypothetical protein